MPRERIQHGQLFVVEEQDRDLPYPPSDDGKLCRPFIPGDHMPPGTLVREEISLDVHWDMVGEYVQISLHAPTDWWKRFYDSHAEDKEVIAYDAFTDRLSRKEINNMIKVLRRARNSAYGTDE